MNKNIAWLIGFTVSDGSLSGAMVRVWNNEMTLIQRWKKLLVKEFNVNDKNIKISEEEPRKGAYKRNKTIYRAQVNSTEINRRILQEWKRILKTKDKAVIKSTVQSIFDAEASVDLHGSIIIWLKKNDKGLVMYNFIKNALKLLMIEYSETVNKDFCILTVIGSESKRENIVKFAENIGFTSKRKSAELQVTLEMLGNKRKPTEKDIVTFARKHNSFTIRDLIFHFKTRRYILHRIINRLLKKGILEKEGTYKSRLYSVLNS